jgi:hypothetical protein
MMVSGRYGTHLPALIKAMEKSSGDVLELGMGIFSTPFLHYQCILQNRMLVSVENFKPWADFFIKYKYVCDNHDIIIVDDYNKAPVDNDWGVVLVDQTPDSSRIEQVKRLKDKAMFIIIHDSNDEYKTYHYSEIYPLFKYRTVWDKDSNHATVLSNFVDLEDFWS